MQAVTAAGQVGTHCEMTDPLYFQLLEIAGGWHAVCATPGGAWKATPLRERPECYELNLITMGMARCSCGSKVGWWAPTPKMQE